MSTPRTYINLINDFWESDAREQFSAPVTRVYFYLLHRINRNRWNPVFISDSELAEATGVSRFRLPGYRDELKQRGLIDFTKKGTGRLSGTSYDIQSETDPKGTVNRPIRDSLNKETDPKGTVNRPIRDSLPPATPYKVNNKTYIRPSTTTKDARNGAQCVVDVVEVKERNPEVKKEMPINGAADRLIAEKKRAAAQGVEILKACLSPYNQRSLESQLMQNGIDLPTYRQLAEETISDWIEKGETHDDWHGNFDIKSATRHMQNTIRKKAADLRRNASAPKSRQQGRQELMTAAMQQLREAMEQDGQPQEAPEAPF